MFKVNIRFMILMIIFFILALLQGGDLWYYLFYALSLTFFAGLIYILIQEKNLKVETLLKKRLYFAGESDEFTTIVRNHSIFPAPYILIKNDILKKFNNNYQGDLIYLNPDGSRWIKNRIKLTQRGIYDFGKVYVSIRDLFYIFERKKNINSKNLVKVYPRVYPIKLLMADGRDIYRSVKSTRSNVEDLFTVKDVRKYREGDNLKKIHWKLSAKSGELYVKNLDNISGEESNIILNMNKSIFNLNPTGEVEEAMIDFAVSLINYMQVKGIESKVFINDLINRKISIENRKDFNELMEFFVGQKSDGETDFPKYLYNIVRGIGRDRWVAVITTIVDENLNKTLINLADSGYKITLFYYSNLQNIKLAKYLSKVGIQSLSFNEMLNKGDKL